MSSRSHIVYKTVVISTHQMLYGAPDALRDYFLQRKINQLVYIGHPLVEQRVSFFDSYKNTSLVSSYRIKRTFILGSIDYVIDFFLSFIWIYFLPNKQNLFVGVDPLNCLVGLLLKKLRKVEKVIYYGIDFVPIRFQNRLLNGIFHSIEKFCVIHADEVWNVSPRIAEGREKFLHVLSKKYPQKVVPIGIWFEKIKQRSFKKIKKNQLLFVGHLLEKQGVQLILTAIPHIREKIPNFHFLIIGGGEYENELKRMAFLLKIESCVTFKGWVREREELDECMSESACAIALYKPEKEKLYNFTYYSDPTKLKDYLGAGLPIILTDVSYNAKDIQKNECGIIVDYNSKKVERAVIQLLRDKLLLVKYKRNALQYASQFNWDKIFDNAFYNNDYK